MPGREKGGSDAKETVCGRGEGAENQLSLKDIQLMRKIGRYNEIDCKAMMEIVSYLWGAH